MSIFSRFTNQMHHCEKTVLALVKSLNINVTRTTIQRDLLEHPNYPSLLSITDVIKTYGIDSIALKIKRENFHKLDPPFIVHISGEKTGHDLFGIVSSMKKDVITIYNPDTDRNEVLSYREFDKRYKATVLLVEAGDYTGERDFEKKVKEEKRKFFYTLSIALGIPILIVTAIVLVYLNYNWRNIVGPVIFTILTFAGCTISSLLLWHDLDEYSPPIKNICQAGKKINCSAILNSRAAKIFGISWSVLGSTYFIGLILALLTGGLMNAGNLFLLSWVNIIALPYIIYSISYQYFVAKQWCVLCLAVQAVLFLQFITTLLGGFLKLSTWQEIPFQTYLTIVSCFGTIFIVLLLLIPALEKAKVGRKKSISLQRLKHNPYIFEALLIRQKRIEHSTKGLGITLGNPNAEYKLIKVCNPYCDPCARAHLFMEELLENNEDLQIQIIFTVTDKENDKRAKPVNHLLTIAAQGNEALTRRALDDWYNAPVKDYELFAAKYPLNEQCNRQQLQLKLMGDWCEETQITFTPTFFIKNYQLPDMYVASDLKYFLQK